MAAIDDYGDRDWTNAQLLAMDESEARSTLTVDEYERWEKLNDLHAQADETREQWADEGQEVAAITVSADMDDLGTEVDIYGNTLLVHIDSDDPDVQAVIEDLQSFKDDHGEIFDSDDLERFDDGVRDELATLLCDVLDAVIVRWDGTDWRDLDTAARQSVLADARREWGLDGLLLAWVDIQIAVREDQEAKVDVIESFRSPERRGRR
jgi:hypothetical protein